MDDGSNQKSPSMRDFFISSPCVGSDTGLKEKAVKKTEKIRNRVVFLLILYDFVQKLSKKQDAI